MVKVSPSRVALAVVGGAWLGHVLEYLRVWGWNGFGSATSRQVHAYMGPVGIVLLTLAFVGVHATLRAYRRLERLFDGLTNRTVDPATAVAPTSNDRGFCVPVTTLLSITWVLQLALYVAQENAELRAVGLHPPVLSVITGTHQWAPAVHLLVACVVVAAVWLLHRSAAELAGMVRQVVTWLLAARRRAEAPLPPVAAARSWTPAERFGCQLWSRPPPAAVVA
ncbi:MAG: hypothetical protein JO265_11830 [Acidimicrobiia bacterium]|nr:hypothetical protein [Acidimicrobiia bacterium]